MTHWDRLAVVAILVLALAVRAASYANDSRPYSGAGLAAEQAEIARNIVDHGKWFYVNEKAYRLLKQRQNQAGHLLDPAGVDFSGADRTGRAQPAVDQMPGLAAVLAGVWWVTGRETYAATQWLQIVLDAAMVLLVYWIAVRLTRRPAIGLVAGLLYAVWPKVIFFAKLPSLNTWAGFFTIGCVCAFLLARDRPESRSRLVGLGLLAGLGIYFRPFIIGVPILLAIFATPGGGWRRRLTWIATPTVVALLVLAPWTIRNYQDFHKFIPTRTGLGQALFQGTGQAGSDEQAQAYAGRHGKTGRDNPAQDTFLLHAATSAIRRDPGLFVRRVAGRTRFLLPLLLLPFIWRRWRKALAIPVAAAVATVVPYLPIGLEGGFFLPAYFAYFILIGMAAETAIVQALRLKRGSVGLGGQAVPQLGRRRSW